MPEEYKKQIRYLFFPVILFVLVFLLDKTLLIPSVQDCCVKITAGRVYYKSLHDILDRENEILEAKKNGKKIAVIFGSSMSYGFYNMEDGYYEPDSPYIHSATVDYLQDWYIIRAVFPGRSVLTDFVRFKQILDRKIVPDAVIIEFSQAGFNLNSPWFEEELYHSIPMSIVLRNLFDLPFHHSWKIISSRLFNSIRFKPGNPQYSPDVLDVLKKFTEDGAGDQKFPESFLPSKETIDKKNENHVYLLMINMLFSKFMIHDDAKIYFDLLLKDAEQNHIPVILFYPALHPKAHRLVRNGNFIKKWDHFVDEYINSDSDRNVQYFNMNKMPERKCNLFIDPMHLDRNCFPEMTILMLQTITKN